MDQILARTDLSTGLPAFAGSACATTLIPRSASVSLKLPEHAEIGDSKNAPSM